MSRVGHRDHRDDGNFLTGCLIAVPVSVAAIALSLLLIVLVVS